MIRKKFKIIFITIFLFLVVVEVSVVLSNSLYFEKVSAKEVAERSMPKITSNAVKHAYAASLTYFAFRAVFFGENFATNATIFLGKANELAEAIFKPNQDSTLEMMKDLSNNLLGICAAKLIEENRDNPAMQDRIVVIGNLAERGKLILTREEVLLSDEEKEKARRIFNYSVAIKWFDENREKISCDF